MEKFYLCLDENGRWEVVQIAFKEATANNLPNYGYLAISAPYNSKKDAEEASHNFPFSRE